MGVKLFLFYTVWLVVILLLTGVLASELSPGLILAAAMLAATCMLQQHMNMWDTQTTLSVKEASDKDESGSDDGDCELSNDSYTAGSATSEERHRKRKAGLIGEGAKLGTEASMFDDYLLYDDDEVYENLHDPGQYPNCVVS